jgi:hypothetical protein
MAEDAGQPQMPAKPNFARPNAGQVNSTNKKTEQNMKPMEAQPTNPAPISKKPRCIMRLRVGSAAVNLFEYQAESQTFYRVTFPGPMSKRQRQWFSALEEAESFARLAAYELLGKLPGFAQLLADQTAMNATQNFAQPNAAQINQNTTTNKN